MPNLNLTPETRKALGVKTRDFIQGGIDQKGDRSWTEEVWAFYENRAPRPSGKGIVDIHMPLSQVRQDALTAQTCTVIAKQDPVMLCDHPDTDLATRRAKFIHKAWDYAGFDTQIRKASTDATNTNKCFYKVTPDDQAESSGGQLAPNANWQPGVDISIIAPDDMSVYPAAVGGCQGATLTGNRLYKSVASVNQLIADGVYFEATVGAGDDPDEHDDTGTKRHSGATNSIAADHDNGMVELWDCVVLLNLKEFGEADEWKRYRVTLAFHSTELLAIEPYPYRYVWYFEGFYITDANYWGGRSVGRNLKASQDTYNKLWSMFYTCGMKAANPPVIGPALTEKFTEIPFNAYIESDDPVQPWSPTIRTELAPIIQALELVERGADQIARVSQNTLGANNNMADTATENSIIASGVAVGIEEYIQNFSSPFPAMAEHTEQVLLGMYQSIAPYYTQSQTISQPGPDGQPVEQQTQGPLLTPEELQIPVCWRVNGTSPSSTPQAKIQSASQMSQLAADPEYGFDKHALGLVIYKNSSLAGDGNVQLSKEETDARMQQLMAAQSHASEVLKIDYSQLTPMEQAQIVQKQFGIQPDPAHVQGQLSQTEMQAQQMPVQKDLHLQQMKQEADHELEHTRARLGAHSEAANQLVDLLGEGGVQQLLAMASGSGGQGMPQNQPPGQP